MKARLAVMFVVFLIPIYVGAVEAGRSLGGVAGSKEWETRAAAKKK
jgi:hypothetical protein